MSDSGGRGLAAKVVPPTPRQSRNEPAPAAPAIARHVWPDIPEGLLYRLAPELVPLSELEDEAGADLAKLYVLLEVLWRERVLVLSDRAESPMLSIAPVVHDVPLGLGEGVGGSLWQMSRFAYIRRSECGAVRVYTPTRPVRLTLDQPNAAAILAALASPTSVDELTGCDRALSRCEALAMVTLLKLAGVVQECDQTGSCVEERDETLMQWEFHDLLFHNRSRLGRHSEPMGGLFRFKDNIPPQPATKPNPWSGNAIALPVPDLETRIANDPPFGVVLEARHSNREQNHESPISLAQISEFLFRSARIRGRFDTDVGEFTSRPYPSGGASYEFELYLTVNRSADVERGVYYYDPETHSLCRVRDADAEVEALLDDAWLSAGRTCRPQVLITINSRFLRQSWKYSGIAYATQLKNVGVLYQTFYLVATAMGLAGCALGLGNADRMARIAGTNYFSESSIGEFMLGSGAYMAGGI